MVRRTLHYQIILPLTLGIGIGLSIIAALFVGRWEASNQQIRFQRQIENLATVLQRNLNRYTDVLAFLRDYYTVTQGQVKSQAFADFVGRSLNTYPGVQALEWAPFVKQSERANYEQQVQAEGYRNFQITELLKEKQLVRAGNRPYYIPVTYIAPFLDNEAAFGFDLSSNPIRAVALESARDKGELTVTGRIRLVQEQRDQFGFLVVLPLYHTVKSPTSVEGRRKQFQGVLLGVFRISDVIEEALQNLNYDIDFVLYDQSATVDEQFLGRYDAFNKNVTTVEGNYSFEYFQDRASICSITTDCTHIITVG
jgi:CHASE1-domain containing sensor protein